MFFTERSLCSVLAFRSFHIAVFPRVIENSKANMSCKKGFSYRSLSFTFFIIFLVIQNKYVKLYTISNLHKRYFECLTIPADFLFTCF